MVPSGSEDKDYVEDGTIIQTGQLTQTMVTRIIAAPVEMGMSGHSAAW